jgi:thiol-disulfide isomerase/thioredoxin
MKPAALLAAAALGLSILTAHAAPPTNDQVEAAVASYRAATRATPRMSRADMATAAETALNDIDLTEATLAQLATLAGANLLNASEAKAAQAGARLAQLAQSKDAAGAEAAALRLSTITTPANRDKISMQSYQDTLASTAFAALAHPGIADALSAGKGAAIFSTLGRVDAESYANTTALADLQRAITTDIHPDAAMRLTGLSGLFESGKGLDANQVEGVRVRALAAVTAARSRTDGTNPGTEKRLDDARAFFDGAFAKGTLVNHPAPDFKVLWSSSPSPITSLADLKGKVVLLDFWATWCGPCIASFPNIRELQARYKDFPVAIIGVTSPQGFHIDQKAADPKDRRIDTKDDPAKEFALMPKFMADLDMTWTVLFSEQNVFNPAYGVFGIPHAVIIDPAGVVRHRGIHPGGDPAEEAEKIDALLKEFKLSAPAAPMPSKREERKGG